MADAEETLVGFVTAQYNKLKKELNPETDSNEDVILLIDTLFQTFKKSDSTHEAIVEKLAELQKAYTNLNLVTDEYPHHKNAANQLDAIMTALKDEKGAGEEEGEE